MANTSFNAVLDEVAGMEEFLVDSPRVKGVLANLRKLRSLEASQLEWFFYHAQEESESVCTIVCRLIAFSIFCVCSWRR